ncbi:MAG: hypothetical protein AB7S26_27225 [Sandaracinaceae bacterium]
MGTALRVGILGANAWVVGVYIPSLFAGAPTEVWTALSFLPLLALAAGVASLEPRPEAARFLLLGAFVPLLALVVASRPALAQEVFEPTSIAFAAASLAAFVAASAAALTKPRAPRAATVHPLRSKEPVAEPARRRWLRRTLVSATAVGGFVIATIVPAWLTSAERHSAWGDASDDSAVLTAMVASLVAAVLVGAIVGPGLRAQRPDPRAPSVRRRVGVALAIAGIAAALFLAFRMMAPPSG